MSSFKLKSEDPEFKDRQKKVFDQLLVLENNRNSVSNKNVIEENNDSKWDRRAQKSATRHFRGKESIFKKPQNPAPKNYINRIPDFKKNPHKWTKYSLEDVQDITDESNKRSAMDFLRELANRKKLEQGYTKEEKLQELPTKIVFNKHLKISEKSVKETTKESSKEQSGSVTENKTIQKSFNSSKLVMPEYVIGQKPIRQNKNIKRSKAEKGKELKLDHLMCEDE